MENGREYSGLFIIDPEKEEGIEEVKGKISEVISSHSGDIVKENVMGKRKLAYPIKKKTFAIYYEINFNAAPEGISKMMRQFRINTDILRTLIDRTN